MREYTVLALAVALVAVVVDFVLKTHLVRQKRFWIFWGVMGAVTTLENGYLTWRPIVTYGEAFNLGFRIITIPVEDYFYGFGLITLNIVLWEYFSRRYRIRDIPERKG
ncbi:MAG: lycopene cyclase domain-containing protein [Proteobacteria bacterium]|nr:lycopene cyclase domain-containing protein [Pseudomonadota bacterium]